LWDDDGATVSWVIKDMTVQTPHAYNCYLAYCAELGIISANADRSGSEWVMSGPNRKGGFYISVGKKNNTNAVELWIAVSNKSYTGVEGTSGFLRPTQTSTAPGGLGVVFNATFPLTVTATLTRNGWRVTTSQAGFTPLAGNWTTDLIRTGNNASISDEFANGVFLFTAGRNHGIDGSGDSYTPNSGRIEKVTVVRNAGVIGGIELLANTGFEADAAGWAANGGSIARTTAQMHGGVAACRSYNRTAAWAGPRQVVKNALLANGPGNYAVGAWLRLASGGDTGRIQVGVKVAGVWTWFSAEGTVPSGGWGQVVGTVPVTWTGTLEDAWFVVNTTTSTAELYVDDCSLQTAVETPPPVDGLENGSFEDGVADWTVTAPNGGTPACAVLDIQGASDGSHAMAFGNANAASNAVLSQSVGTVADTVYALRFDYGAFGASGKPQRLRVEALDGTTVLASAEVVALGPGNFVAASTTFAARTLAIAATSASTTIRFTDVTAPTDSITCDGMLDNVELVAVDPALAALRQAYVDQQFGMFLHYGMGTYTGEEWASPNRPINTFAPTALDTDQWAAAAKSAGMRYGILTTKHHDGFALWDSSRSVYDVAGTSWFAAQPSGQGDIVRRYADSFRAQGLKVGFYYSIWDRSNGIDGSTLTSRQATDYVKAELTELLTNYGPIHAIWTDGWGWKNWHGYVLYQEVYDHVKALSPSTLLVENNHTAVNTDIRTYEQTPLPPEGNTFPSELCATIRSDGKWFWSAGADATKSVETLREQRSTANARNAAYLLDVTPDPRGLVPDSQRNGLVLLQDGPDEAPAAIMGFHYDSSSGIAEITIQGAANTTYRCVACGDIGFGETAGTVSLWQADAASDSGTVGPDGTTVTADADGNATVRLTLGQEPRRFLRVETVP
jgi:alpha-L-fucosidase